MVEHADVPSFEIADILRGVRRRLQKDVLVWSGRLRADARRGAPSIALMPTAVREGSSLLRMYHVGVELKRLGWQVMLVPPRLTLAERRGVLDAFRPDIALMQTARHPLNRPGLYPGHRVVIDMDDADFHMSWLTAAVTEDVRDAAGIVAGSEYIADWCRAAGAARADVVWTGTPRTRRRRTDPAKRPPVVAWPQGYPASYAHEADLVTDAMARVLKSRPDARLRLYDRGREAGMAEERLRAKIEARGIAMDWLPMMSYRDYLASFDDVAVGLAPLCPESLFSRGKSFGKILAYLDRKVPVVASEVSEPARFFTSATGIFARDAQDWADAILHLLDDGALRTRMAGAAHVTFRTRLTTAASAAGLSRTLLGMIERKQDLRWQPVALRT